MEITILKDKDLAQHDTGGGTRDVRVVISVDASLPLRRQRGVVIYETLGCLIGFVISHEYLDEIATILVDALDQLEVNNGMDST